MTWWEDCPFEEVDSEGREQLSFGFLGRGDLIDCRLTFEDGARFGGKLCRGNLKASLTPLGGDGNVGGCKGEDVVDA